MLLLVAGLCCPEMSLERESSFEGFSQKEQDICNSYIVAEKKSKNNQASDRTLEVLPLQCFKQPFLSITKK